MNHILCESLCHHGSFQLIDHHIDPNISRKLPGTLAGAFVIFFCGRSSEREFFVRRFGFASKSLSESLRDFFRLLFCPDLFGVGSGSKSESSFLVFEVDFRFESVSVFETAFFEVDDGLNAFELGPGFTANSLLVNKKDTTIHATSVTRNKLPNAYKSCPKMIRLEK